MWPGHTEHKACPIIAKTFIDTFWPRDATGSHMHEMACTLTRESSGCTGDRSPIQTSIRQTWIKIIHGDTSPGKNLSTPQRCKSLCGVPSLLVLDLVPIRPKTDLMQDRRFRSASAQKLASQAGQYRSEQSTDGEEYMVYKW